MNPLSAIPVVFAHLALVFVASRIAGLHTSAKEAVIIGVIELIAGIAVLVAVQVDVRALRPDSSRRSR